MSPTAPHNALELMNIAASIARQAGDLVATGRVRGTGNVDIKSSPTDIVTQWDQASESLIVGRLGDLRPNDSVLGEEGTQTPGTSGITWLVDPIDGTTNFLYNLSGYAVSIAATDDAGTLAAAVYLPVTRELFVGARGHGAWLGARKLKCSPCQDLSMALIGTGFSYSSQRRDAQGTRIAKMLPKVRDIRRCGAAAADLCYVADGRLDAYFEEFLQPWDLAAGLLIATEAGAIASDFSGSLIRSEQTLLSTPGIHQAILALLTS
ncbi:inositol-1-monophosphatase [Actinomycetes bacterium]|nr:inositol-1-monophosphatase [Actinomycetes bacterium]